MERSEQVKLVEKKVADYLEKNSSVTGISHLTFDEKQHVIKTGAQILFAKWDFMPTGWNSFVDAFVSDKLSYTFSSADSTNIKAIYFYCLLSYNMAAPDELFEK